MNRSSWYSPPSRRRLMRRWLVVWVAAVGGVLLTLLVALRWIGDTTARVNSTLTPEQWMIELRRTGRPVQALYLVETAALESGWTGDRLRLAGDLWREIGDQYAAAAYWERAALETPDDPILIRDLAETYLRLGEWTHAADALEHYHTLNPSDRWAAYQLGMIRAAVDPQAVDLLQEAAAEPAYAPIVNAVLQTLRDNPNAAPAERALHVGVAMAEAEQWDYAELAFTQTVGDPQWGALALAYTGWARDMQDKDGSSDIRQAVALAPDDARVRYLQGLHYRQINDYPNSILALEQAVALDPARPEVYAELGLTYELYGDHTSARYWLETALAMSNNDPRYQVLLNRLTSEEQDILSSLGIDLNGEAAPEATADAMPEQTPNPIAP
ncbi:MAG: tetratricopeptide repeat protein [Anaerolineae bacterium]